MRYRLQVWNRFTNNWQDQRSQPTTTDDYITAAEWWVINPDNRRVIDTTDGRIIHQPRD